MDRTDFINRKREAFRKKYSGIAYNAYVNTPIVCIIFVSSLIYTTLKVNWDLRALLLLPFGFIYGEAIHYLTHRYQQHKKVRFLKSIYEMHAVWHHGMFSSDKMNVSSFKDMNMVLLPFIIHGFVLGLVYLPLGILVEYFFNSDLGWILMFSITIHLIWYEIVHTVAHVGNNTFLRDLSRHHRNHHNHKLMGEFNFGIGTTIFDKVFGTRFDK